MSRNEMDTMADTSCAGSNWSVLEWMGHSCDVYPFNEQYEATKDVPIATCATLIQGEGSNDFILVGHRNNTSNSGPPWMMDKCGHPRSRPIEVLIAHKLIL